MKQEPKASPRAIALLLATIALPATPLLAQDIAPLATPAQAPAPVASTPVAPPPVVRTAPDVARVAPPPVVSTAPTIQAVPAETARPAPRTVNRARPAPVRRAAPAEAASIAAAPLAAPTPATPAPVIEPVAPPPAAPVAAAPAEAPAPAGNAPIWPWLLGGIAILAALIGFVLSRRRRAAEEEVYYDEAVYEEPVAEPAYVEPAYIAAVPVAAYEPEPVIEEVAVVEPEAEEVEAVVAAAEPVAERPWIELGMRPVRAGTDADDAVVEFELTVANAGNVAAEDVRISTWMFTADPALSENERMMIEAPADSALAQLDIAAGDGKRVDAAIALPKAGLHQAAGEDRAAFVPVVGAEARYRLPDGSEGLISASFAIGVPQGEGEAMAPFFLDGGPDMQENVEARLYGALERA